MKNEFYVVHAHLLKPGLHFPPFTKHISALPKRFCHNGCYSCVIKRLREKCVTVAKILGEVLIIGVCFY